MVMPARKDMHYTRDEVAERLRFVGLPKVAEQAAQELPETLDGDELYAWAERHGVTKDYLISRMGGSP